MTAEEGDWKIFPWKEMYFYLYNRRKLCYNNNIKNKKGSGPHAQCYWVPQGFQQLG